MAPFRRVPPGWLEAALAANDAQAAEQAKAADDRPPFPFLRLPREIRDAVYEYALVMPRRTEQDERFPYTRLELAVGKPKPIRLTLVADFRGPQSGNHDHEEPRRRRPPPRLTTHPASFPRDILTPGLLAASRQLHTEALPVLYSLNAFVGDARAIHFFLHRAITPVAVPLVRTLHVWGFEAPPAPPLHRGPTMATFSNLNAHPALLQHPLTRMPKLREGTTWERGWRADGEPGVLDLSERATGVRELIVIFCSERLVGGREGGPGDWTVHAEEAARVAWDYAGRWVRAWVAEQMRRRAEEKTEEERDRGEDKQKLVEGLLRRTVNPGVAPAEGWWLSRTEEPGFYEKFREVLGGLVRRELWLL